MLGALQFPLDLKNVEKVIRQHGVTMIVLDPCKGLVPPDFKGNDDVAVRQYLEPIGALCNRTGATLIGLAHFGKRDSRDPGKLLLGSIAWSQVARSVISVAEIPDTGNRVLTNTKTNYSPEAARSSSASFRKRSTPPKVRPSSAPSNGSAKRTSTPETFWANPTVPRRSRSSTNTTTPTTSEGRGCTGTSNPRPKPTLTSAPRMPSQLAPTEASAARRSSACSTSWQTPVWLCR